jgi:hypothetical protein
MRNDINKKKRITQTNQCILSTFLIAPRNSLRISGRLHFLKQNNTSRIVATDQVINMAGKVINEKTLRVSVIVAIKIPLKRKVGMRAVLILVRMPIHCSLL